MAQPDNPNVRPFTRTRWWWIRHAPVRAHGGQIYGQADLACDCSDDVVLQSVARVLPHRAVWVSSHLSRAHHTAEALWRSGYFNENEAAPPLRSVPEFAEQHLGEWRGLDRARFAAGRDHGAALWCLGPGHELLIGPVPTPLPVRVGLQSPTHLPLPHRCLPPQTPPAGKGNSPEAAHASGAGSAPS